MSKLKLLFITQDLAVGGGTSSLSSLYNGIKDRYDIAILLLTKVGNAKVSYSESIIYPNHLINFFYSDYTRVKGMQKICVVTVKAIARLLGYVGIDIEKQLARYSNKHLPVADYYISFGEGVATSFTSHINSPNKATWIHYDITYYPKKQDLTQLLMPFAKIVCVADNIAEGMKKMYPELSQKIIAIHNLVDVSRIRRLSEEDIEEQFQQTFNIVSIGRVCAVKAFSKIPIIARQLVDKGLAFHWRIIGPYYDTEYDLIQSELQKSDITDYVELMGDRQNPYPYLKKSDLLVSTSFSEACPMVLLEARILGVPVVANNFTTASEFIDDGVDGIISPISEMGDSIYRVANNEKHRDSLIQNANLRNLGNDDSICKFEKLVSS